MLTIQFENQTDEGLPEALWAKMQACIRKTLLSEQVLVDELALEVSLTLVSPETIRMLNANYRSIDRETDVLSFPMLEFPEGRAALTTPSDLPVLLGDIVLNPRRAAEQGKTYGTGFEREMCYLTVHSVLHLLGYDHMKPADKRAMRAREKAIMGDD